jgi:hypothetical protein
MSVGRSAEAPEAAAELAAAAAQLEAQAPTGAHE